jgi:signal transduction histidine kinase
LENEKLKLNIVPVNIITIIKNAITTISPIAKMKKVNIIQEIPEELPAVMGDQIGLHQVFVNLLNNAVKFSNPENDILIKVYIQVEKSDKQSNMETGVSIWIQDHGIGIPEEEIPKLFTKFYRAQNAINNDISGSGIGLYITKSIVDELKGKIKVESKINQGTTFEIWLPSINDSHMHS